MRFSLVALLPGLALALMMPPAGTAEGDEPPANAAHPVEVMVSRALERSPTIAALSARLEAARRSVSPAGALPDPVLEFMIQNAGFPDWTVGEEEMSMIGPRIRQGFPFPGKQRAMRRVAEAEALVQGRELDRLRRQVALEIRVACARLYALDAEARTVAAGGELADLLSETVTHHYALGAMNQEDVAKAHLTHFRMDERRTDLVAERAMLMAGLNRLLDRSPGDSSGVVFELPDITPPATPWDSLIVAGSAEVHVARAMVETAERRLRMARLQLRPDFMAGAGLGFRGDLDAIVSFEVGVELPLWQAGKQRPLIRAADAELEAARADLRDAELMAAVEAAKLEADWRRANEQVLRYREGIVPQTSVAFDAARAGYLAGRGDFSTVVEDFNLWLEARASMARREADRYITWASLTALISPAPEGTPARGDEK